MKPISMIVVALLIGALLSAATALADGTCGHDFDAPTACPITTSGSVTGTLEATFENDYFVFYAVKRTKVTLSITNAENPMICNIFDQPNPIDCSWVFVYLYDSRGNAIAMTADSQPDGGVPAPPEVVSRTVSRGTYYAVVSGTVNSAGPPPYSLDVKGLPNVTWPPCIVPKLRRDTGLSRVKALLARHDCSVGRVRRVSSRRVRRGDVVGLRPREGTAAPYGHRVGILVSSGR